MLNKEQGELLEALGPGHVVVPIQKWSDTEFFSLSCGFAANAFEQSGAILPVQFNEENILIQEYPKQSRLVFIFEKKIAGVEHFYFRVWEITGEIKSELLAAGRWQSVH